jgi:hypothetical protein
MSRYLYSREISSCSFPDLVAHDAVNPEMISKMKKSLNQFMALPSWAEGFLSFSKN